MANFRRFDSQNILRNFKVFLLWMKECIDNNKLSTCEYNNWGLNLDKARQNVNKIAYLTLSCQNTIDQ